jgi:broad specificity phosphatase PhoE
MKLLLIRHAQSVANSQRRWQGQFDSPLTDHGRTQARALAGRLLREEWAVSALYASDLSRAAETAQILATHLGAPLVLDERLREYDIGVLTNLTWPEIETRYPEIGHGLRHSQKWMAVPGEEGNAVFYRRMVEILDCIQSWHKDSEAVAVVSHGGSLAMILAHLLGLEPRRPLPFRFGNTSLSIVEFATRGPILVCLNDTCHLDDDLH